MMKKFLALLAVVAMVGLLSSLAFAADVSVGGSIDIRSRDFRDLTLDKNVGSKDTVDTQERIRLNVNVKSDNVKAKVSIENDWDTWGRFETPQGNAAVGGTDSIGGPIDAKTDAGRLDLREAWVSFDLPFAPVNVTGGHQLLQLGNGWWFRSMKYGSDAWVVANVTGPNTAAFVNVKIAEGTVSQNDDTDAYVLLDVFKINENMSAGIDITYADDRRNALGFGNTLLTTSTEDTKATNVGLNFNGKLGPVALKAEVDVQDGKAKGNDAKFKGNQIVVQGNVPLDPITINFTLARGSGKKATDNDYKQYVNFLDADQHYTLLYEYKIGNPGCIAGPNTSGVHAGFCNTTAISAGVMANVAKSLAVGVDVWQLIATEKIANVNGDSDKIGMEVDAKVNWKLYDNLSWNWTLGYFKPDSALKTPAGTTDAATGVQGVLSYQF